jgi:O-antigen ligase
MVLTAPYYYYRFALGPLNLTLFRACLVVAFFWTLLPGMMRGGPGRTGSPPTLTLAIWLFAGFSCLTILQVARSRQAIAVPTLFVQTEGLICMFVLLRWASTLSRLQRGTILFCTSAMGPIAISVWQVMSFSLEGSVPSLPLADSLRSVLVPFDDKLFGGVHLAMLGGSPFPRIASTLVDANFFGVFLAEVLLLAAGLSLASRATGHRVGGHLWACLAALSALPLAFTMSRSAWAGVLAGGAVLAVAARVRTVAVARLLLTSAIVIGAVLLAEGQGWLPWTVSDAMSTRLGDSASSLEGREELFGPAWRAFGDHPILGVGRSNLIDYSGYPTAHSFYLTRLAEDGVVGALLAVGALIALLAALVAGARRCVRTAPGGLLASYTGALVALLVANLAYDHLMSLEVNWVFLGLAAAAARAAAGSMPSAAPSWAQPRPAPE